jgi:ribosomal protein S27E
MDRALATKSAFLDLLANGCNRYCVYGKSGIMHHCAICQMQLTTLAFELFVKEGATVELRGSK